MSNVEEFKTNKMNIGIGVTTYKRPKHLKLWEEQVAMFMPEGAELFIAHDNTKRLGIAARKNQLLLEFDFKKCDYIFLFDDDCFPIKEGWADLFINASKLSTHQHMMYLKETGTIKKIGSVDVTPTYDEFGVKVDGNIRIVIDSFNNCAGCMMFLTRDVLLKVGGYGKYLNYGFEHAGYSDRIHQAGLTPLGRYSCPAGVEEYIYSMDYDYSKRELYQRKVDHKPSMGALEMKTQIAMNKENYERDIEQVYQTVETFFDDDE